MYVIIFYFLDLYCIRVYDGHPLHTVMRAIFGMQCDRLLAEYSKFILLNIGFALIGFCVRVHNHNMQRVRCGLDLHVAAINSVVVSNNQLSKLNVLVRKCLKCAVKRCNYKFEPLERVPLKPGDLLLILESVWCHPCAFHQPNLPVT